MNSLPLFLSVFLACAVEAVEATTIVLAAGTARDWKSALLGTASATALLGVIIAALGPSITKIPHNPLRLVVGGLLLVFGLQWVRKAILRSSGYKALHDEDAIFEEELAAAKKAVAGKRFGVADWYAFTLSFKGVLLEGLEVVFIVLTFGTLKKNVGVATLGAVVAVVIVVIAGFALRKPLSRVPENTMKYIVGIMLTSFGIFWASEGAGVVWPKSDGALALIIPVVFLYTLLLIRILSRKKVSSLKVESDNKFLDDLDQESIVEDRGLIKLIKDFAYFWYDFLIGDDLIGTAIVLASLEAANIASRHQVNAWWALPLGVAILLPLNLFRVA
jgi:uncharacterized membrane protein